MRAEAEPADTLIPNPQELTWRSRRRSGHRCCIRPALRPAAASSPRPNAACVFVFGADKHITRDIVADIRGRAAAHGRDPRDILISSLPGTNGLVAANITSAA
jgi:alkanesulfonate monooxygenase SsuD/methylene tetrahydromethanopterin reductase-like flavin-dependent oxidoreductase (luciferase family)